MSESTEGNSVKETKNTSINVVMYGTRFCPYCMFARRLFKRKGITFTEIKVSGRKLWDELEQKSGRNTVPQIFINDESLGGYDDIAALDRKGELDQKLGIK
ncbi:MAG: glutaredoxin 3 [Cocleimonas sp.]